MSQSGSGEPPNGTIQNENAGETQQQHRHQSNGPNQNGIKAAESKPDLSNGFENRTVDYERMGLERNPAVSLQQPSQTAAVSSRLQQQYPHSEVSSMDYPSVSQTGIYPTSGRLQSTMGQPEDRHPVVAGQLPVQHQQYPSDKAGLEHAHVSQTATQTLPVQIQPHFVPDFVPDQSQYPQARGQFEVRSQMYAQQAGQYGDRVGYVTRDVTYRDSSLYAHTQGTGNPVFSGPTGGYVTVQHSSQLPSQSASPQPPGFYPGVIMTAQPTVSQSYGQFGGQSQYTYSQYPQTLMNPIPYNPHAPIYTAQQFNQQTSPNPQRYSQEVSQYQGQPIIQPIAQNVIASGTDRSVNSNTTRGPKPMVPPRINSKITSDSGNRKSITDMPVIKPMTTTTTNANTPGAGISTANTGVVNQNVPPTSQEPATTLTTTNAVPVSDARSFPTPVNQTPRTRQDGLYVDSTNDQSTRDTIVDTIASDCGLYVSRSEHRKSVSVDVTTSFPRRNDTITFTFPGDTGDASTLTARKPPSGLTDKKWTTENNQVFQNDSTKRIEPVLRVSAMPYDVRQDNRKSVMSDITNRKPSEWGNISPNQRPVMQQENRRSDYFEEHRRSPMPVVIDPKRIEDVRRSPMPFMAVRDSSCERAPQNSPSYVATQNFEKTRQELVIWAEQRQRHDVERTMLPNQMFTTSPRSRNPSEERRDPRVMIPLDEQQRGKDVRVPQVAFQPIPNISQNTIMEQRRHLRHVSADLTKHMELSRKDFEDQPITGSVANLGPGISTTSSQRASPNLCHQFPALSEAKLDTKTLLTVVTDFSGDNPMKPLEQSDHIIHSHKKSHNISACLLTHSKSQAENLQSASGDLLADKTEYNHSQQHLQQQQQQQQQQQMHNQQSLDMIAEKLSQFERQQSDLQARLQCLQNQNQLLDQVAQYQHHQTDLQSRLQCLQDRQATEKSMRQAIELQQKNVFNDMHHMQMKAFADQAIDQQQQQHHHQSEHKQIIDHQHLLHRNSGNAYLSAVGFTNQMCQSLTSDRLSPRIQVESSELERASQITLPTNSQFERNDGTRGSQHQYRLMCQSTADAPDNIVASCPSSSSSCSSSNTINVTSASSLTAPTGVTFSGTLKKVPPEKPPRTSLIVQSPEAESNRSQPAIGLKQTPKARMDDHEIQSTVESILGPGVKVVDCEKKSSVQEEEVLLINGVPIALEGPDGIAIREAMLTGQIPPCDLLNQILVRAGILRAPVRLETSLSVKSSVVTKEEVTVARAGKVVDERSRETKDNNYYTSSTSEIWEPVGIIHRANNKNIKPFDSSDDSRPNSNASSDQGYTTHNSSTHVLRERGGAAVGCPICEDNDPDCAQRCLGGLAGLGAKVPGVQTTTSAPTIFGTVASDLNPKDGNSRRSLPQTPAGGVGGKGLGSGCGAGTGPGMVNGAAVDHQDIRDGVAINTEHALVYRDGNLVSGSLEALVQHMVPTEDYYPDRAYLFAFLLSARLFIKPHELLGEVCALCEHQQNLNGEGGKERLQRFVPRLVQLLAEWTETFPYDFRDERVMGHVRSITQKVAAVDAAARQEVSALLQNLLLRLTALERYEEGLSRLATEAATEQLTQVDVTELCPSATVLAQQLTHVELERLSYIGPEEFVQAFAKESPHLETSFKDMKKTRNLESYVQWFNRLSYFVATEVCKHAKKKQRVRVVEYWIETARECFNIGNFNSLMAIIAGLNMSPISRLKKTWSKVQSAKFSILEHQMDPSSNFSSYRSTLKAAMWRSVGATDERQRIVVPFFSLLVKDLYFLNEGCSNKLPNGHINFEKFWQLAKQVTEFIAWKQVACPFEKNSRVIAFLQASPVLTENALALASFECEPPDNNPEKERYKALKSDLNAQ